MWLKNIALIFERNISPIFCASRAATFSLYILISDGVPGNSFTDFLESRRRLIQSQTDLSIIFGVMSL